MRRDAASVLPLEKPIPFGDPGLVVRTLTPMLTEERRARIAAVVAARTRAVVAVLEDLTDPHNGAAILRTADALGVHEVHVIEAQRDLLVASAVSKSAARWLDLHRHRTTAACVDALKARGYRVLVAAMKGEVRPQELGKIPRVAIVFGNEHTGASADLMTRADATYAIPMHGFVESLNVSVAAAITLHSAMAERGGDLDPADRLELEARCMMASVERAEEIIRELVERGAGGR
jgi:tRNA (guanosine-2'-O-)-methyltransferase